MGNEIIDDVEYALSLKEEELNELLLNEKYNKANLRELLRRTLKVTNEYKRAFEYEKSEAKKYKEALRCIEKNHCCGFHWQQKEVIHSVLDD